eukprot:m51a1_g2392 hypothetical protein (507) ;mRNA; r:731997-734300
MEDSRNIALVPVALSGSAPVPRVQIENLFGPGAASAASAASAAALSSAALSGADENETLTDLSFGGEAEAADESCACVCARELDRAPSYLMLGPLRVLDLSFNGLEELPPEIGQLQRLRQLWLKGNALQKLPVELRELSELQALGLEDNSLREVPETVCCLVSLQRLYVDANDIKELPESIEKLEKLVDLTARRNRLSTLPDQIGRLSELRFLSLESNCISRVPDTIGDLSRLRGLWLDSNLLSSLPHTIRKLKGIERLSLAHNKFDSLPVELLSMTKLKKVNVVGNLFDGGEMVTDCETLMQFLDKGAVKQAPQEDLPPQDVCASAQMPSGAVLTRSISSSRTPLSRKSSSRFEVTADTEASRIRDIVALALGSSGVPNSTEVLCQVDQELEALRCRRYEQNITVQDGGADYMEKVEELRQREEEVATLKQELKDLRFWHFMMLVPVVKQQLMQQELLCSIVSTDSASLYELCVESDVPIRQWSTWIASKLVEHAPPPVSQTKCK